MKKFDLMEILKKMKSLNSLSLRCFDPIKVTEAFRKVKQLKNFTIYANHVDNHGKLDKTAEETIFQIQKTLLKRDFPLNLIFKGIKNLKTHFKISKIVKESSYLSDRLRV